MVFVTPFNIANHNPYTKREVIQREERPMNVRSFISTLLIVLFAQAVSAQVSFERTYGGANGDVGYSIMPATDGGYVVAGYTGSYGAGSNDVYVIRTDASGDTLWTRTYGGSDSDEGNDVIAAHDAGYMVLGWTRSFGAGDQDIYLIKIDASGDTLWTRTYGGPNQDGGESIARTPDGGYIIVGSTYSFNANGGRDAYLIKIDANGDTLWTKMYGRGGWDRAFSVAVTSDDGLIITGYSETSRLESARDVYLLRTDSNGDTLWTRTYGGGNRDLGGKVLTTGDGGYFISGYTQSFGAGGVDFYAIKTDASGDTTWTRTYGGPADDFGWTSVVGNNGYFLVGRTESFGAGDFDVYLISIDDSGNLLDTWTFGGSGYDAGNELTFVDSAVTLAGPTASFGAGNHDVYLIGIELLPPFTEIPTSLINVNESAVAWGDYDNDGDLDILLTGHQGSNVGVAKIYRNDDTSFVDIGASLTAVYHSKVAWGDYDNDGDLDILLTGYTGSTKIAKVYRNDSGSFIDIGAPLIPVDSGPVAWGDYDNDGDLDILLTGYLGNNNHTAKIYRNNGDSFTDIPTSLPPIAFGSVAWGDYDNDGDLDILLAGRSSESILITKLYRNDGGSFTDIPTSMTGVDRSSVAWGDYDNDGDLDILLTGDTGPSQLSTVYRNNIGTSNTVPTPPTSLAASVSGDSSVTLNWAKATDGQTVQDALTYNLRVGTSPGGVEIGSPMADVSTGFRRIAALSSSNHRNSWTIRNLPEGIYYWSVQSIDNAFAGSAFADEQTFTIGITPLILVLGEATATAGNTAAIPLTLTNPTNTPVGALQFEVVPDDTGAVQFESVINAIDGIGFNITTETVNDTTIVVVHPSLDPEISDAVIPPGTTVLGQLIYRISGGAAAGTVVALEIDGIVISDTLGMALPDSGVDGSIAIGIRRGDLSGDGAIDVRDVVLLLRILLGKDPTPDPGTSEYFAADANGDGGINVADAVYQINVILRRITKTLASGPRTPVVVGLGDLRTLENGRMVIPITMDADGVLAAAQATLMFDPSKMSVGIPQLAGRADGMTLDSHVSDGTLRLVLYSMAGEAITPGSGPALLIPVTILGNETSTPSLTLSGVVLSSPQAQVVPVTLGTHTVKVSSLPTAFSLSPSRPNPFNPSTTIAYDVPQQAHVALIVYNVLGQEVIRLVDGVQAPGRYTTVWHGTNAQGLGVASGIYVYRMTSSSGFSETKRMTLLK